MKSCWKVAAKFKIDKLYCLIWQESHKRDKLWNVHFVTLTTYLLTPENVYLIIVPTFAVFSSAEGYFPLFPLNEAANINTCFHNWKHWFFFNPTGLISQSGFLAHLGLHREESPAGFFRSLIFVVVNFKHFSGSLPHKLQQPPQHNVELNYAFPSLWFYSHICQLRHLICRIVYYFLSYIQPFGGAEAHMKTQLFWSWNMQDIELPCVFGVWICVIGYCQRPSGALQMSLCHRCMGECEM